MHRTITSFQPALLVQLIPNTTVSHSITYTNDTSTDDLLNLCTFLDPRFKFDYIKKDNLYDSTVALIKGIVQREVVALIKKESQETEAREEHDDFQNKVAQPSELSQLPRKKKHLAET